jgi:hypothetical protein
MNYLNDDYKSQLSLNILESLVNKYNIGMIDSKEKMESIIEFIRPMVEIEDNKGNEYLLDKALNKVCKLVYVPSSKDPYEQLEMLQMLKSLLVSTTNGNEEEMKNKKLILYYNNYINVLLLIGYSLNEGYTEKSDKKKDKTSKIHKDFSNKYNLDKFDINNLQSFIDFYKTLIKEIDDTLTKLKLISSNTAYKLYLQCILLLNRIGISIDKNNEANKYYEESAINFINKTIAMLTEGEINQKNKLELLVDLIGNICYINILSKENMINIAGKIEKICEKIKKKDEQCISMINCSKLYYNENNKDINKIIELLNKAKKTAVYAMTNPENTILFINILNEYLKYDSIIENFDQIAKVDDVSEIIEAINNYLTSLISENNNNKKTISKIENYYKNTKELIKLRKINNNKDKENKYFKLFEKIDLENQE